MADDQAESSILMAISWRALKTAEQGDHDTQLGDCIVALVFAGFYIEANVNMIVNYLDREEEMAQFLKNNGLRWNNPDLIDKLFWFYGHFVDSRAKNKSYQDGLENVYAEFPGLKDIIDFREQLAHGRIERSKTRIWSILELRQQAKDLVDALYRFVKINGGVVIPRETAYFDLQTDQDGAPG